MLMDDEQLIRELKDLVLHFWTHTGQSQVRYMTPAQREVYADVVDEFHERDGLDTPGPLERWWQMGDVDPTRIDLTTDWRADPLQRRLRGIAYHGNTPFDMPFITQVDGNLWQGGCENGLVLPDFIEYVFSLYPWEQYTIGENVERVEVKMYDSADGEVNRDQVLNIASAVRQARDVAPTLVHCQAGLNRSGLIAATVLILDGYTPKEAVDKLRESRSPAVLCNPLFERFILNFYE